MPMTVPVTSFPFHNGNTHSDEKIRFAFAAQGLIVSDIQRKLSMWTYVLTDNGNLWLHDKTHGCGGYFKLEKR